MRSARPTLLALAILAAAVGGCKGPGVTLPPLPAWRTPANSAPILAANVAAEAKRLEPGAAVRFSDNVYVLVSRAWLDDYLEWTWTASKIAGVAYTPESFDCDDFAVLFRVLASRAAAKAGVRASPLMAWLVVRRPDGSRHELIGVATDRGIFVVEPQPDAGPFRITALDDFKDPIESVSFGD